MTRKEIIDEIKSILEELRYSYSVSYLTEDDKKWLEETIKTLEQEPCEDAISRQAAIDDLKGKDPSQIWDTADVEVWVNSLPPTQTEIIRCGQCKYAEVADKEDAQDGYTCQFHRGSVWFSGSYCSWAERRTEV